MSNTPAAPPTPEQLAADDATFATYQRLKGENPFVAVAYCNRHRHAIYRSMARQAEDSSGPVRAIQPRNPVRSLAFFK